MSRTDPRNNRIPIGNNLFIPHSDNAESGSTTLLHFRNVLVFPFLAKSQNTIIAFGLLIVYSGPGTGQWAPQQWQSNIDQMAQTGEQVVIYKQWVTNKQQDAMYIVQLVPPHNSVHYRCTPAVTDENMTIFTCIHDHDHDKVLVGTLSIGSSISTSIHRLVSWSGEQSQKLNR